MKRNRAAVIIPVYNHEEKVEEVIRQAMDLFLPIFIVDDGSTDATYERIKDIPGITVLRHAKNMGKGAALMTGFSAAARTSEWAITVDADGQHNPADAWNLFRVVPTEQRPIVVGYRKGMGRRHVPLASRFGRGFSNFWVRTSGGPSLRDTQSGFRLYPLPDILYVPADGRRFQYEVEILVRARWRGMPVLEAPVGVTYAPRGERVSHYRGFVDFFRNASTFSRLIILRWFILPFVRIRGC
ncbi:MAG: glycosyltransferase family 2 protein [Deltaproteobacteria bacterium]|jgi:glycosyltransferase involved in cell wall biosynthesis|nr:glycosyltransferase family 2 protein [Deltaproteobacteria bacterium]